MQPVGHRTHAGHCSAIPPCIASACTCMRSRIKFFPARCHMWVLAAFGKCTSREHAQHAPHQGTSFPGDLLWPSPPTPRVSRLQVLGVIEEVFSKEATEQLAALEAEAAAHAASAGEHGAADAGGAADAAAEAPTPAGLAAPAGGAQEAQRAAGRQRGKTGGGGAAARRAEEQVAALQAAMADQAGEAVASDFVQVRMTSLHCPMPAACAGCLLAHGDDRSRVHALPAHAMSALQTHRACPELPARASPAHPLAHLRCPRCPSLCCCHALDVACRAGETPLRWRPWRREARRRRARRLLRPLLPLCPQRPPSPRQASRASLSDTGRRVGRAARHAGRCMQAKKWKGAAGVETKPGPRHEAAGAQPEAAYVLGPAAWPAADHTLSPAACPAAADAAAQAKQLLGLQQDLSAAGLIAEAVRLGMGPSQDWSDYEQRHRWAALHACMCCVMRLWHPACLVGHRPPAQLPYLPAAGAAAQMPSVLGRDPAAGPSSCELPAAGAVGPGADATRRLRRPLAGVQAGRGGCGGAVAAAGGRRTARRGAARGGAGGRRGGARRGGGGAAPAGGAGDWEARAARSSPAPIVCPGSLHGHAGPGWQPACRFCMPCASQGEQQRSRLACVGALQPMHCAGACRPRASGAC